MKFSLHLLAKQAFRLITHIPRIYSRLASSRAAAKFRIKTRLAHSLSSSRSELGNQFFVTCFAHAKNIISASARSRSEIHNFVSAVSRMACCNQFLEGSRSILKIFADSRSTFHIFRRLAQHFQNISCTRATGNLIIFAHAATSRSPTVI